MQLIHNGACRAIDAAVHPTVGDVLAACAREGAGIVVSIRLDGQPIEHEEHAELAQLPTAGAGRLEVESRSRRELACSGLESAQDYACAVEKALRDAAALLRGGELARAHALCRDAFDALAVLVAAIDGAARSLGTAADSIARLDRELEPALDGVALHFERTDWIGVADQLEYEVAARVAGWPARIEAVRAAARAQEGGR